MSKPQSIDKAYAEAEAKGCEVKFPGPLDLFVDIDDEFSARIFERGIKAIRSFWPCKVIRCTPSPSGRPGRYHIVVLIDRATNLSPEERLTLQAILGSDPKREILGHIQLDEGEDDCVTRFFEKLTP